MSHKLQPVRGTHDILPEESRKRRVIEQLLATVATCYGYKELATPIFEFSEVFHRTLGDTSDVVTKETYTFTDRGGDSLTLRPEFTASVVRAFLSNSLQDNVPFKVFYYGPAFRYERPQKGRLRQFHQFGAELLGDPSPMGDIEMIAMAMHALALLGFYQAENPLVKLELNSLGDAESRKAYRDALVSYFRDHQAQLSADSKQRLERNPLRILDSKDEGDRRLCAGAPKLPEYFTSEASDFFAAVQEGLTTLGVRFQINPQLVRGLDYYSHTVFEFTTEALGSQGTVLAGGRYDGLVKLMGGPDIPGVGFAAGIERLLALVEATGSVKFSPEGKPVAIVPVDDAQERQALVLAQQLRYQGFIVELITRGNMSKKMKRADKLEAKAVIMIGENEVQANQVAVKRLDDGSQQQIPLAELVPHLKTFM